MNYKWLKEHAIDVKYLEDFAKEILKQLKKGKTVVCCLNGELVRIYPNLEIEYIEI